MVTIGATHDSALSRVRIAVSSAPAGSDYATIERSTDGITWTVVRGGEAVTLVGGACSLDDFEFAPNVLNTYRATYVDTADPALGTFGTASSAVNAPVTPTMPTGVAVGDVLVLKAAIRNTAGSVNTPAGWDLKVDGGNFRVFTRPYQSGDVAPTVTFSGGVAGADTTAHILRVTNADAATIAGVFQANASAQNIAHPAIAVAPILPNLVLMIAWKQSETTLTAMPGPWVAISRTSVTTGDDQTMTWWRNTGSVNVAAGTVTCTGGVAAISEVAMLRFARRAFVSRETTTTTPPLTQVWLKNVQRPFLNKAVKVIGFSSIRRPSRSTVHEIVGRSDAVGVTELRAGKRFTLRLELATLSDADEMDTILSTGSVVFLHTPADCPFPGGHYLIDETELMPPPQSKRSVRRYIDLPLVQVAAPAASVVGTTYTWQGVVNDYATWSDLIAANATWGALLERIGDPTDVVVP